ncbi:MAG: hypothetical protein ACOC33_04245 [bacterium]
MGWVKNLFREREKRKCAIHNVSGCEICEKYKHFDIEYLPNAKRYFPRYRGYYLQWWTTHQNYTLESNINGCEYSNSEEGAKNIIDNFIELSGVGVTIIKFFK